MPRRQEICICRYMLTQKCQQMNTEKVGRSRNQSANSLGTPLSSKGAFRVSKNPAAVILATL